MIIAQPFVPELKQLFGADKVTEAQSVLFQHTDRVTPEATHLDPKHRVLVSNGRSAPSAYRKGQVSATVFLRAITSALRCCNISLSNNEVCIQLCGGTPEPLVAALVAGYKTVIYVASTAEDCGRCFVMLHDIKCARKN